MRHSSIAIAAVLLFAAASAVSAQELSWKNPGNYDYAGHQRKMPGEVDVPNGTPPGFDAAVVARPSSFNAKVSGMAFLSDGRMALAD